MSDIGLIGLPVLSKGKKIRALIKRLERLRLTLIPRATAEGNATLSFYREEFVALAWAIEMLDRDYGPGVAPQILEVLDHARAEGLWDGRDAGVAREVLAAASIMWDGFARGVVAALVTRAAQERSAP